ncbi:hypothetical protein THAOC_35716, partial [Thalassiosira oceanica]
MKRLGEHEARRVSTLFDHRTLVTQRASLLPQVLKNLGSGSSDRLQLNLVRPEQPEDSDDAPAQAEPRDAYVFGDAPGERDDTTQQFEVRFDNGEANTVLWHHINLMRGFLHGEKHFHVGEIEEDSPWYGLLMPGDCLAGINGTSVLPFISGEELRGTHSQDGSQFLSDDSFLDYGKRVDLQRLLGIGALRDSLLTGHVEGTMGQVVSKSTNQRDILVAYKKHGENEEITWGAFVYAERLVRRYWGAHPDEEGGEGDEQPRAFIADRESILGSFDSSPDQTLEELEPLIMEDGKFARLSLQLFIELLKIRMFGNAHDKERVLRDHPFDKQQYSEEEMANIEHRASLLRQAIET